MKTKYVVAMVQRKYRFNEDYYGKMSYDDTHIEYEVIHESDKTHSHHEKENIVINNKDYVVKSSVKNIDDNSTLVILDTKNIQYDFDSLLRTTEECRDYWRNKASKMETELFNLKRDVEENYRKKWFRKSR